MPYPPTPSKEDKEKQFARFMELFKKLQINILFSEALEQIPIPITIGDLSVGRALLDLGASINLMPLSMLDRVGQVVVKLTRITL
uniref:Aspartic peptidase DDI1-type domain-containing protein n=1 Tax=Cajanus cajan TaxID=3821 RepID=A0A151SDK4_CAJCA|nr:hypothetical protein KK1_025343 [Cajanus cajan]